MLTLDRNRKNSLRKEIKRLFCEPNELPRFHATKTCISCVTEKLRGTYYDSEYIAARFAEYGRRARKRHLDFVTDSIKSGILDPFTIEEPNEKQEISDPFSI